MQDYEYTFKYQCDDKIYEMNFSADVDMSELKNNFMYFLRGCSWTEAQTAFLEEDPEEPIRSAVLSEQYDRMIDFIERAKKNGWTSEEILENLRVEYIG